MNRIGVLLSKEHTLFFSCFKVKKKKSNSYTHLHCVMAGDIQKHHKKVPCVLAEKEMSRDIGHVTLLM